MVQSATVRFEGVASLSTAASFDAGRLTSDGGLPWLAEADQALGLCAAVAACVPEWRHGRTRHPLVDLVRQRVDQIGGGHVDRHDATALRADPRLTLVCGPRPESAADLGS